MAGGPAWCQEAALLLTGDELDAAAVPTGDAWSDVDFTVEHLEPADEPNVLGRLGGYDVLEIIGHGGMGVVLKGFDRELKRSRGDQGAGSASGTKLPWQRSVSPARPKRQRPSCIRMSWRFIRCSRAGGCRFWSCHWWPESRWPSGSRPTGTLELKEILRIGMQAAAGLAAAHEQGLVHRDVKPANILLEKGVERAVLTDFGLACAADDVTLTRWGIIAGTPQYMSPEQARGEPLDGRSDLFSLGCVLYEMATGVSPFRADSMMATMRRLVDDSPQAMASLNPELPPWFIAIVDRLLEKDPSRRFNSAKEVSELLEGCLAHVQQPANVPLPAGLPEVKPAALARHPTSRQRSARWWGTIVALLLLGLGGIGAFMMATAEPSNISGEWTGDDWGKVVLKPTASAEYLGTYTDTVGKEAGKIELKWSRIERRYNGTWSEGKDRFGEISVHQVGDEIRGAWTTNRKSEINPRTPALADLLWVRPKTHAADKASPKNLRFGPEIEQSLNEISVERNALPRPALNLETNEPLAPPDDIRDFQSAMPWAESHGADIVACSDGGGRGLRIVSGMAIQPANWDAPAKEVAEAISAMELGLEGYKKNISGFQDPRDGLFEYVGHWRRQTHLLHQNPRWPDRHTANHRNQRWASQQICSPP